MKRSSDIDQIAADWLARRDSSAWTGEDRRRLDQWLEESLLHRVAYLRLEHVWERSERLKVLGAGPSTRPPQWEEAENVSSHGGAVVRPPRRWWTALAAGVLLVIAFATSYQFWSAASHYETPVGGIASVPIPDGSKITLNTDSQIRVHVTDKVRRVDLEQGEAFFEIAKDPTRPFVVHAGRKRVIAVGTKFSVRRNDGDIQVVVTEGKVRVESEGGEAAGTAEPLVAGTIVRASDAGILLQTKSLAEVEETLSWRQGVLVFHQMTLADAGAEFNRYNTRKIVIVDPQVGALRVAGSFRANNVDAFVRLVERGYALRADVQGEQIILSER